MSLPDFDRTRLPTAVRETAARLASEGFGAWLVGESLARILRGEAPAAFELATRAGVAEALGLFPRAVPTQPARGVVTVPTEDAPVDLLQLRWGKQVEDDLAHRDFTVFAMAWAPADGEWVDPWSGREDLASGRLRAVGDPAARLHEDPVRILRAARLVAEWGLSPDRGLEDAMGEVAPALAVVPAPRQRAELCRVLLGPHAEAGLRLLRRTGVEKRMVRDVREDAAALVAALPARLELRLAAWLRGARSRALLKRLRFGMERSDRVELLLANHPLDQRVSHTRDRSVLRLQRQLPAADLEGLFALRELELASAEPEAADRARKSLAALRNALERVRRNAQREQERTELVIRGEQVMDWLGLAPGRPVGAALRFAAEWIAEDPTRNDPETLRAALIDWQARGGGREG